MIAANLQQAAMLPPSDSKRQPYAKRQQGAALCQAAAGDSKRQQAAALCQATAKRQRYAKWMRHFGIKKTLIFGALLS